MAQTGYTPISIYYSSTSTNVPTAGNLVAGELAINTADGKLFYKDSAGVVQVIGTKGGVGTSTTTQVLYNSSGLVVGSANMTFNGTTLTLANDASISGLTVGKGGGALTGNTVVGNGALAGTNTGTGFNNAFGQFSLAVNTSGNTNNAFGYGTLAANTSGYANSAFGHGSLNANTTGISNTAIGLGALIANTTASYNTAIGFQANYVNTTGNYSSAFGYLAGYSQTTGTQNTALGSQALYTTNTGGYNTAVGYQAGYSITTGSYNTCLGIYSGSGPIGLTTGSQNTLIGYGASTSAVGDNYEIVISTYSVAGKGSSTGLITAGSAGAGGIYQGNNSATWSITSDVRLKKNIVDNTVGLDAISKIQVRNFEYRTADEVTELEPQNAINIQGVQLGAIAQELQAILPECVKTESTGVMSVDTTNLTWYLINAVKELNAKVTALEAQLGK